MTLAFVCGFFVALSAALGLWVWYLYSQIELLKVVLYNMAESDMEPVFPQDEL